MSISYPSFRAELEKNKSGKVEEETVKEVKSETKLPDFDDMTKIELDEYAEEKGIELDRRKSKNSMVKDFMKNFKV
jgi:hypothetical protein